MLELELASLLMASQPPQTDLSLAEFDSFIRGFHVYKDVWTPVVGEMLLLKWEPTNAVDYCAVGVYKESELVGHVPFNISSVISQFLRRDCNKGFSKVTGPKVNRGAGYGLEIQCTYKLYGPKFYVDRILQIIASLQEQELL